MHFALPPRKSSNPPPYARRSRPSPLLRRKGLQLVAICVCGALFFLFVCSRLFPSSDRVPPGTPKVVIVTPLDRNAFSSTYIGRIVTNRESYAARHGYGTFYPDVHDYDVKGAPSSWARVPAMRHAMSLNPHTTYFFHLDQRALIMNPTLTVEDHIMDPARLESLMLKDASVVPPDSVIKTFSHLKADHVDLVLTQDDYGLGVGSMIVRRGQWADYFLDSWFDPIYRTYNFQNAEAHALEHLVQWHPTILARLALVPQRTMNAYNTDGAGHEDHSCLFVDGDFVVHLAGCTNGQVPNCEQELSIFYPIWESSVETTS